MIVTAGNCPACQRFHKRWNEIKAEIKKLNKVKIVEINLPTMRDRVVSKGFPKDLQRYVQWYPTAFLFNGEEWNDVMKGKKEKLDGVIFNGIVGNPNPQQGYPLNKEGLIAWISMALQNPKVKGKAKDSKSPRDPRSALYALKTSEDVGKRYIPTSGSAAICRQLNIKPKNRI